MKAKQKPTGSVRYPAHKTDDDWVPENGASKRSCTAAGESRAERLILFAHAVLGQCRLFLLGRIPKNQVRNDFSLVGVNADDSFAFVIGVLHRIRCAAALGTIVYRQKNAAVVNKPAVALHHATFCVGIADVNRIVAFGQNVKVFVSMLCRFPCTFPHPYFLCCHSLQKRSFASFDVSERFFCFPDGNLHNFKSCIFTVAAGTS